MIKRDEPREIPAEQARELADEEHRNHRLGQLFLAMEDRAAEVELEANVETEALGPDPSVGPPGDMLLGALEQVLASWREATRRDVMGQIKAVMAKLGQKHAAGTSWLALADHHGDVFSALVTQAQMEKLDAIIGIDEPGIVPHVLRTNTAHATGNTRDDPYYQQFVPSTRSEQAVPISYETKMRVGPPQAVVNQESRSPAQYHGVGLEILRQEAQALLAPLLSECDVLDSGRFPCVWNPRRHGWGIHVYLETLLHQVKEQMPLNPRTNNLHLTIWYVDLEDCRLSTVADTGFSDGVRPRESLPIEDGEMLGDLTHAPDEHCETWRPGMPHVHERLQKEMGTLRARLIVLPELAARNGKGRFRTIIQIDAFTKEVVATLPGDRELREFGRRIHEQIAGYLELYPRFAAYEIRRVLHESRSFSEQGRKAAETMERVLRSDAVTLYARPLQNCKDLHIIAATAPLKRANVGLISFDPKDGPIQSLLPASHHLREAENVRSYAGTLAGRPGCTFLRNSARESGKRIIQEGFPRSPSLDHSEDVSPWTISDDSNDKRFLGYALPNALYAEESAIAVVLAVRPVDRASFKAWDEAALVAMLDATAPMIRSWRDWSAVRLQDVNNIVEDCGARAERVLAPPSADFDETLRLAAKREIWKRMILEKLTARHDIHHRLRDPIPRSESLESLTRQIVASAYERAYAAFGEWKKIRRATVLAEGRDGDLSVVHPIAWHHAFPQEPLPEPGSPGDPRSLPITDLGGNWRRFFDEGRPREFRGEGKSGLIVPLLAWVGGHAVRGALALELAAECDPTELRDDFMLLARRLAAGWTAANSTVPRGKFASKVRPDSFTKNLRKHLRADWLRLSLVGLETSGPCQSSPRVAKIPPIDEIDWCMPAITSERRDRPRDAIIDPDCALYGIQEAGRDGGVTVRIPLRFGTEPVGSIVADYSGAAWEEFLDDPRTIRAGWVRDTLAAWSLWSWSWGKQLRESVVIGKAEGRGATWTTRISFPPPVPVPPEEPAPLEASSKTRDLIGGPLPLVEVA